MQKNIYKKTTSLIFLTIFLFGVFLPFSQSSAQETSGLRIEAEKYTIENNIYVKITAQISNKQIIETKNKAIINFFSSPSVEGFDKKAKCEAKLNAGWSCFVSFRSSASGQYEINASITEPNTIRSNLIKIVVCAPGQTLDKGFCIGDTAITTPPNIITPETPKVDTNTTYTPLAGLPGLPSDKPYQTDPGCQYDDKGNVIPGSCKNPCPFGNYLNIIIKLVLGIAAVLAMVMIVMGGVEYITTDLISSKEEGKERITHAILGLLIALGAYMILNTINPQLLSACLDKLPQAKITILPFDANINSYVEKTSGSCKPVASGDCSVQNLTSMFGNKATNASMICNIESGGKADLKSNYDYCSLGDKVTFSFGLFQINLLANGDKIPKSVGNCANLFTTTKGEEIGYGKAGYIAKENDKFKGYDCKLKTERGDDYKKCRDYLLTSAGNLEMAKKLFTGRGNTFGDWEKSDSKICSAAFQ